MNLQIRIEEAITKATGEVAQFSTSRTVFGGCINDSRIVSLKDKREVFVKIKSDVADTPGLFASEFKALNLLAAPGTIRVPIPITYADNFIVMEVFSEGARKPDWQERIGCQLAQLHQATQTERFGFEQNNYLGTTLQPNAWKDDWLSFWCKQRLGWQLELFKSKASSDDHLLKLGNRLLGRLDDLLAGINEPAVLLHGDLWSGNAAADEQGEPIIFDPASYYGHREAEIGMMRLFGGFGPRCEAAYAEVWPLQENAEQRIKLYRLYHELNHLNLFGRSYYQSCITTMRELL